MVSDERMKELIALKNKQRSALKADYLRQILNPYRHATGEGGTPIDAGIQRFTAMEATRDMYYKPTVKNALLGFLGYVVPVAVVMYLVKRDRDAEEAKYRSGWVSYRDREYKFI